MDVQAVQDTFNRVGTSFKDNGQIVVNHIRSHKRFFIKMTVVFIVVAGWLYAAWGGGLMGLWACVCSGVAGYLGGIFTKDEMGED